jgi:hypothetical protein
MSSLMMDRERNAGWFALVMNAAAALEDAAISLRDADSKRAAEGAAKHYRDAANAMWGICCMPADGPVVGDWRVATNISVPGRS